MTPESCHDAITQSFVTLGLPAFSIVGRAVIDDIASIADPEALRRYGFRDSAGAVVVVFPYDPRPDVQPSSLDALNSEAAKGPPPYIRVGAFAAWNHYAALSRLLQKAGRMLAASSGLAPSGFRVIVNSRLPEKPLALAAGLGFIGRSSLLVSHAYGPACLIGALLLPAEYELGVNGGLGVNNDIAGGGCGTCRACLEACPTGAILPDHGVELERCIQYWTTKPGMPPAVVRAAWADRLYGCDACVAACPHSARATVLGPDGTSPVSRARALMLRSEQRPGSFVSASFIFAASDEQLRLFFKKTALGLSWVGLEEVRRNAELASPSHSLT